MAKFHLQQLGKWLKCLGVAVGAVALAALQLPAQSPAVTKVTPGAALPGKTTELVFSGANLRDVTGLWCSFDARAEFAVDQDPAKTTCRLTVPFSTPIGIGAVRLATKMGLSGYQLFMVDDLPTIAGGGSNHTRQAAQSLNLPVAVEGACDESKSDFYRFFAKAGQSLSVEVVAQRLGSKLDPVLRLLDANGRELAYSDDDPGVGGDARFIYKFATKGEYFIELRDLGYQGGNQHAYRLRLGDFPLATAPFPMGVKAGTKADVVLGGRGLEITKPITISMPEKSKGILLGVKNPGGRSSGFLSVVAGDAGEVVETEPNDTSVLANTITIPATVNGRFLKAKDRDYYAFDAQKGDRLLIVTKTRAFGSPSEPVVQIRKPDGSLMADASDGNSTNTFAEAGTYFLSVEDATRKGGPDQGYRIEIAPYRGFGLSVESGKVEAPIGEAFDLKVSAARRDFKGAIMLALDGLPAGTTVEGNVIAEDKNDTTVKVKLPQRISAGEVVAITVSGRAKVKDTEIIESASTMPALRAAFPSLPNPPVHLDGIICLSVKVPTPPKP